MRSLRPTGWRRVSVRAGPTDRLEDSPEGRQPDLHWVRPGSGTHPHADQFCLCSGGPSAGYVNPRCRIGGRFGGGKLQVAAPENRLFRWTNRTTRARPVMTAKRTTGQVLPVVIPNHMVMTSSRRKSTTDTAKT